MDHCPACGITWLGDEIPDALMAIGNAYDRAQAEDWARCYGWTPENKKRFSANHIGIEYEYDHPYHYDGVSEWKCTVCEARFNRFTGEQLKPGESAAFEGNYADSDFECN